MLPAQSKVEIRAHEHLDATFTVREVIQIDDDDGGSLLHTVGR